MIVMNTTRERLWSGLRIVALWWFLSAYVAGVLGAVEVGKDAAILNLAATTVFSVFIAVGVFIGSRGPAVPNNINLAQPKAVPDPKPTPVVKPVVVSTLKPYSAYIETRGRHGTIVVIAKSKEAAKKHIIELYPDAKLMYFDEWLRDRNYITRGNLDG